MDRYAPADLDDFLLEVDRELTTTVHIWIIGGAAVALDHGHEHVTKDIDLWRNPQAAFWEAVERVRARTGSTIPVGTAGVAQPPDGMEDRCHPYVLPGVRHLHVWLPERHDLVIMKTVRCEAADLDAIVEIHRKHPLDLETLIQRQDETYVIGPGSRFRLSFLTVVGLLFGELTAEAVLTRLWPNGLDADD